MNRKINFVSLIIILSFLFCSCVTQEYFADPLSRERQKELLKHRSGNAFTEIGLFITSIFIMAAFEVDTDLNTSDKEFKKLKLINPTTDTLYINMLTDVFWDEENYCDFMDIRIPPKKKCIILVPVNANYNVYFSPTLESDDDEILEINTDDFRKISLYPGLTKIDEEKLNLNQ